jgi:hypothetical protein
VGKDGRKIVTEQWKKEIDDALAVMGGLQARQGRVLREHSEWLEEHQRAMQEIDRRIAALIAAGEATDARIDKLVSGMGEFMRRNSGEKA